MTQNVFYNAELVNNGSSEDTLLTTYPFYII